MFLLIFLVDLSEVLQSGFLSFFRHLIWNIFALNKSCICMRLQVCEIKGQAFLVQRFLSGYKPNEVNSAALNTNYCQHVLWELSPCTLLPFCLSVILQPTLYSTALFHLSLSSCSVHLVSSLCFKVQFDFKTENDVSESK